MGNLQSAEKGVDKAADVAKVRGGWGCSGLGAGDGRDEGFGCVAHAQQHDTATQLRSVD
jgi:hypothetical protein